MIIADLPSYPSKGTRRFLDQQWLALLHQQGVPADLAQGPESPEELRKAVAQFNQGEYWECHETLERIWLPERYPLRLFYHGLIKAAVGLLHMQRHNRRGARIKLRDAAYTLAPFAPQFGGVDIDRLMGEVNGRLRWLERDGPVNWEALDQLPRLRISPPPFSGG